MSKKNLIIGGIIALVLIVIIAISNQKPNTTDNTTQTNSGANASQSATVFETIATVQDLKKRLEANNPNEILVDVRTPEEFTAGHIPEAINIDVENPNFGSQIGNLDKTKTYITFCRSGNRALIASQEISKIGLKTVYSKSGFTIWQDNGFQIEN